MNLSIPTSIFRAYDIRGIYNDTLTDGVAYLIGRSIGSEVLAQGQDSIALARDGRLSGPVLLQALSDGIRSTGCHVVNVGMVPTPALYFATYNIERLNSGVMLTGSHNPGNYNGFKIVINGTTLSGDAIQALRERIEAGNFAEGEGTYREQEILELYEQTFLSRHSLAKPMKVVVDCGNGIAGVQAPQALAALGCEVVPLFAEVDGTFPNHHPDPGDDWGRYHPPRQTVAPPHSPAPPAPAAPAPRQYHYRNPLPPSSVWPANACSGRSARTARESPAPDKCLRPRRNYPPQYAHAGPESHLQKAWCH